MHAFAGQTGHFPSYPDDLSQLATEGQQPEKEGQ